MLFMAITPCNRESKSCIRNSLYLSHLVAAVWHTAQFAKARLLTSWNTFLKNLFALTFMMETGRRNSWHVCRVEPFWRVFNFFFRKTWSFPKYVSVCRNGVPCPFVFACLRIFFSGLYHRAHRVSMTSLPLVSWFLLPPRANVTQSLFCVPQLDVNPSLSHINYNSNLLHTLPSP